MRPWACSTLRCRFSSRQVREISNIFHFSGLAVLPAKQTCTHGPPAEMSCAGFFFLSTLKLSFKQL